MVTLRVTPVCPKYLAEAPVGEFIPPTYGLAIHQKKRKLQIRLATPCWADRKQIRKMYEAARSITRESGTFYVVDHIVPLHHALVCGLHVPANLRIVSERVNAAKKNRFDVSEQEILCAEWTVTEGTRIT